MWNTQSEKGGNIYIGLNNFLAKLNRKKVYIKKDQPVIVKYVSYITKKITLNFGPNLFYYYKICIRAETGVNPS